MSHVVPLLKIEDLQVDFATHKGTVSALDGVSFELQEGEILGVVGESGCGKSVTAEAILQLLDEDSTFYDGKIMFNGENLLEYNKKKLEKLRGNDIAMIFKIQCLLSIPLCRLANKSQNRFIFINRHQKKNPLGKQSSFLGLPESLRLNKGQRNILMSFPEGCGSGL